MDIRGGLKKIQQKPKEEPKEEPKKAKVKIPKAKKYEDLPEIPDYERPELEQYEKSEFEPSKAEKQFITPTEQAKQATLTAMPEEEKADKYQRQPKEKVNYIILTRKFFPKNSQNSQSR